MNLDRFLGRRNKESQEEKSVIDEYAELKNLINKHVQVTNQAEKTTVLHKIDELKSHVEGFINKAAAGGTVLGLVLAGLLASVAEKQPAAFLVAVVAAFDIAAAVMDGKVEHLAEVAERQAKVDLDLFPREMSDS